MTDIRLTEHIKTWSNCSKCGLCKTARNHVLYSSMNEDTDIGILFVGEGPGKGEDVLGVPFVGRAGRLLRRAIMNAGAEFIGIGYTNLVACRPTDTLGSSNRHPSDDEIIACETRLVKLIEILSPTIIVTCGVLAAKHVTELFAQYKWAATIVSIHHPAFIERKGGITAPEYGDYVNTLRVIFEDYRASRRLTNGADTSKARFNLEHAQRRTIAKHDKYILAVSGEIQPVVRRGLPYLSEVY